MLAPSNKYTDSVSAQQEAPRGPSVHLLIVSISERQTPIHSFVSSLNTDTHIQKALQEDTCIICLAIRSQFRLLEKRREGKISQTTGAAARLPMFVYVAVSAM